MIKKAFSVLKKKNPKKARASLKDIMKTIDKLYGKKLKKANINGDKRKTPVWKVHVKKTLENNPNLFIPNKAEHLKNRTYKLAK